MTAGHKHRTIHLPHWSLRKHLLQTPLAHTFNSSRAQRSRWTWGYDTEEPKAGYVLTPLGILHTLFGLTVDTNPKEKA